MLVLIIEDVRDRLELVFGIPAASMFATDRYTFLKKITFGRKGKIHRVLGYEVESDKRRKTFVKTFEFVRGSNIDESYIKAFFIKNEEANKRDFSGVDLDKLSKHLDLEFIPPVLVRRSSETGISAEQYILQAFYKGKVYYDIYKTAMDTGIYSFIELDFVLKANTLANKIMISLENENGEVDFGRAQKEWEKEYKALVKRELPLMRKEGTRL